MKPTGPKIIITIGLSLFLISFLLPAYSINSADSHTYYGYKCAYIAFVIGISGDIEGSLIAQILTRVHYFLLGLHNVILPASILLIKKSVPEKYSWALYALVITTLNTIIFFFYNQFVERGMEEVLHVGYYAWVLSSLLILIALIRQKDVKLDS